MADPYGMSFGERGRGASQAQIDQHMANVYADPGPSQAEVDRANRQNAAYASTVRMRQNAEAAAAAAEAEAIARGAADLGFGPGVTPTATEVALANAQATDEARARQAAQNRAMMVGTPAMGFTPGQLASGPGAYFARYGSNAPAVMEYMNSSNPTINLYDYLRYLTKIL